MCAVRSNQPSLNRGGRLSREALAFVREHSQFAGARRKRDRSTFALLYLFADEADANGNHIELTQTEIGERLGWSRRNVQNHVKRLIESTELRVDGQGGAGRRRDLPSLYGIDMTQTGLERRRKRLRDAENARDHQSESVAVVAGSGGGRSTQATLGESRHPESAPVWPEANDDTATTHGGARVPFLRTTKEKEGGSSSLEERELASSSGSAKKRAGTGRGVPGLSHPSGKAGR